MRLYVGVQSDRGSIKKFAFDLLEMPVTPALPKEKTLREMRASRPQLKFSLRLHPDVAAVDAHQDVERVQKAAVALSADAIVIPTGPRFTPTARHRSELTRLAESLRPCATHVAWEPRGVWTPEESDEWAKALGLLLVRDLTREVPPSGDVVYTRLLPFGFGARVSQNAMEQLAARLEQLSIAYVVVQSDGAKRTRATLRDWFELEGD